MKHYEKILDVRDDGDFYEVEVIAKATVRIQREDIWSMSIKNVNLQASGGLIYAIRDRIEQDIRERQEPNVEVEGSQL